MPMPISVLNEDGTIRYINHAAEKYLAISSEKVKGEHCHDILHPSHLPQDTCPLCQSIQKKSNVEALEIYNPLKQMTVQYTLNFMLLESQASIVHICQDITPIYKQGKEIETLNKRMALSLRGFKAGMYEWNMLDNSAYLSAEWKVMLGYDKNEPFPEHLSTW